MPDANSRIRAPLRSSSGARGARGARHARHARGTWSLLTSGVCLPLPGRREIVRLQMGKSPDSCYNCPAALICVQ